MNGLGRNREWDRLPEKGKRMFYENLPFPYPIVIGIFLALFFGIPAIASYVFNIKLNPLWISFPICGIYVLFIAWYVSKKYRAKTGRDFDEDITEIENKADIEKEKAAEKTVKEGKTKTSWVFYIWIIGWTLAWLFALYAVIGGVLSSEIKLSDLLIIILVIAFNLVNLWIWLHFFGILKRNKEKEEKFLVKSYYVVPFIVAWFICGMAIRAVILSPTNPPLGIYFLIGFTFIFPILWLWITWMARPKK